MIPFSVLDLSPVLEGETPREALQHSVALARRVEALGYHRYWLAEHHNTRGHRLGSHGRRDRPRCRGDVDDPRRRRRGDAAESSADGDRRAVRARSTRFNPRPHRPRARPRARRRRHGAACSPPPAGGRRSLPRATCRSCSSFSIRRKKASASRPCPAPARACRSTCSARRTFSAQLAAANSGCRSPSPRISRRTALGDALPSLSQQFQTVGRSREALCDGRRRDRRRGHRCRGPASVHLGRNRPSSTCGAAHQAS